MPDTWDFQRRMMEKYHLTREQAIEFINDVILKKQEADLAINMLRPDWRPAVDEAMVQQEHGNVVSLARRGMR